MTTQTIQKEEDLIILWDDTIKDTSFLDFDFDSISNTQSNSTLSNNITNESFISFWEEIVSESKVDLVSLDDKNDNLINFWEEKTDFTFEPSNFDEVNTNIENNIYSNIENTWNNLLSRIDILDEAISKMKLRKNIILESKNNKQLTLDELNSKINELKKDVELFENQIIDLDKEDIAIDLDISSIEKMKNLTSDIQSDRQRKHNLDTIKKTK